ncbi:MAG: hypothetical protein GY804_14435 [Alphaproteobacteria bacterium]|nr:hypothetical protein [Alphaproteobacteria bacterium]
MFVARNENGEIVAVSPYSENIDHLGEVEAIAKDSPELIEFNEREE